MHMYISVYVHLQLSIHSSVAHSQESGVHLYVYSCIMSCNICYSWLDFAALVSPGRCIGLFEDCAGMPLMVANVWLGLV